MKGPVAAGFALVALMFLGPSVAAQSWPDSGSMAGDPRVLQDGRECFEAVEGTSGVTCSVLYAHIFDLLNFVPLNLQRPADCHVDLASGWTGTPGVEMFWDFNQVRLTVLPGFVEYGDCADDKVRLPMHGFAPSTPIQIQGPLIGYWYLSADADEFAPLKFDEGPDAGVLPCVTVRMTLYAGRPFYSEARDTARALAVGETTKTIISAGAAGSGAAPLYHGAPCPGGRTGDIMEPEDVTEFRVELLPVTQNLSVSANEGVSFKVEWYQFAPGDPESYDKIYMSHFNQHTGADYPNRLLLAVADTMWIKDFVAVPVEDTLYLDILAESVWGSYDVDPATLTISLVNKDGDPVALEHLSEPTLRFSVDHDGALKPVRGAYAWDVMAEGLEPGAYSVVVSVQNYQHTVTAERSLDILVGDNGFALPPDPTLYGVPAAERDAIPAPAPLPVLLAAAALLLLIRRSFSHTHKNVK